MLGRGLVGTAWLGLAVGLSGCGKLQDSEQSAQSNAQALTSSNGNAKVSPFLSKLAQDVTRKSGESSRGSGAGYSLQARSAAPPSDALTELSTDIAPVSAAGEISVLIYARALTGSAEADNIVALGGRIESARKPSVLPNVPQSGAIAGLVPADALSDVADLPWVVSVVPAERGHTNLGSALSEGVSLHRADTAQSQGINGAGVTVGAISDGVKSAATSQGTGDLPATCPGTPGSPCLNVLSVGGGDEGTAMLEIVADMAPGANLLFNAGAADHNAVRDQLVTAGANVITEDLAFDTQPVFQSGDYASHSDAIAAAGVSIHSSAGNLGTSHATRVRAVGTGQGPDGKVYGATPPGCSHIPDNVVEIGPNHATTLDVTIFGKAPPNPVNGLIEMQWSEPRNAPPTLGQGGFTDLNLYLMDPTLTTCLAEAVGVQANGVGDTLEIISANLVNTQAKLVVDVESTSSAVSAPMLDLRWRSVRMDTLNVVTREGSLDPQNNFTGLGFSVGAANAGVGTPGAAVLEGFSGGGPIRFESTTVCPGGTAGPCTGVAGPAAVTAIAPTWSAADGTAVTGVGFGTPFFGTSAAAPHSAACDALVRQSVGVNTPVATLKNRLTVTATPLSPPTPNNDSGAGVLDCFSAVGGPTARCKPVSRIADATCHATVAAADVDAGSTDPFGAPLTLGLSHSPTFGLGTVPVTLTASDPRFSDTCSTTVSVRDATPPVLTVPADVTTHLCQSSETVTIGQATAVDNCASPVSVTGQVISRNGVALSPPISVVSGVATLQVGSYVVRWTATDGVNPSTRDQNVTVGAGIETGNSFVLDDRAQILNVSNAAAALLTRGTGATRLGVTSLTASILSGGAVSVADRATVRGDITSAGNITVSNSAMVSGSLFRFTPVVLPPLPTLPAFPPPTGSDMIVNSGERKTLNSGSYRSLTINSGGTVVLGAGDFFFQSVVMVNSNVRIQVAPTTRIFVANQLAFRSSLVLANNAIATTYLGFAGTSLVMEAPFNGQLLAPNAQVTFGVGAGLVFRGSFFANMIEVRPDSRLVCL